MKLAVPPVQAMMPVALPFAAIAPLGTPPAKAT
jgi:hypothetical protein